MSTPVPQAASAFALATVRTGRSVRTGGLTRLVDEGAFVVGHNLHKTGEAQIPLRPAGRTVLEGLAHRVQIPYVRSEGAQVARLAVELHPSDELADSLSRCGLRSAEPSMNGENLRDQLRQRDARRCHSFGGTEE